MPGVTAIKNAHKTLLYAAKESSAGQRLQTIVASSLRDTPNVTTWRRVTTSFAAVALKKWTPVATVERLALIQPNASRANSAILTSVTFADVLKSKTKLSLLADAAIKKRPKQTPNILKRPGK